jgi:DNA-binding NarL/FixJ family response regulator
MSKPNEIIRVLIADHHSVMRRGVRAVLEEAPDIKVVGEAKDNRKTKKMMAELRPDILLLDLMMPGSQPYEIGKWVRTNYPETIALVLTAHNRDCHLAKMIEAGAVGFFTKEETPQGLVDAIRRAAQGDVLVTKEQLDRACAWRREVGERWASLTKREREVLTGLAHFKTDGEIAEELNVSVRTVHHHVCHILSKLNFANRREAARWMLRHKLAEI